MRGVRSFFSWVLALALIAVLLLSVDGLLLGDPDKKDVVFSLLAQKTGMELFEPTGRFVFGAIQAFAALMLFFPFSRKFGAFLVLTLAGSMMGAHLTDILGQEIPLELGGEETDGASQFYLMIAQTAASGLILFIHPGPRRRRTFN